MVSCLLQIQSVRYWLVSHGVLCLVWSRYKVHGIGWFIMVSFVLFAPDTKYLAVVGLSWCLVSCLLQIQSTWYWLVSHGVLFVPDTKYMVLVGLSWCLVWSRYKVHGIGWSLMVSCLFQIQSAWYWLVSHGVLFAPDTKYMVLVGLSWCLVWSRYKVHGIGWSLIVSCLVQIQSTWYWLVSHGVLFGPDTKYMVLVGLSWCLVCSRYKVHGIGWSLMVSCLLQIQSTWYWLVSHGVLFVPDTKYMVLVGLSWCLVWSRDKVHGIGWFLMVSCLL